MRFVELKSEAQLDIQTLHRVRSRLVATRKTLLNQLRALLLERGHIFPQGRRKLEQALEILIDRRQPPFFLRVNKPVGGYFDHSAARRNKLPARRPGSLTSRRARRSDCSGR
jgi:transposase